LSIVAFFIFNVSFFVFLSLVFYFSFFLITKVKYNLTFVKFLGSIKDTVALNI